MSWYYMESGEQKGPISIDEMKGLVSGGTIQSDTHVWTAAMGKEWKMVSEVEELSTAGEPTPMAAPPIPAAAPTPQPSGPSPLPAAKPAKKGGGCLKAGGIGCLVVILILGIGGYFVFKNIKSIGAKFATSAIETVVKQAGLPPEEHAAVMQAIDGLADDFTAGTLNAAQMGKVMEEVMGGPLTQLVMIKAFEKQYLKDANLSDAQKSAALQTTSRFAEAYARGAITDYAAMEQIGSIVSVQTTDGIGDSKTELKNSVTPAELQQCLSLMTTAANQANIPNKQFSVDIGKVLTAAIEDAKANQQ